MNKSITIYTFLFWFTISAILWSISKFYGKPIAAMSMKNLFSIISFLLALIIASLVLSLDSIQILEPFPSFKYRFLPKGIIHSFIFLLVTTISYLLFTTIKGMLKIESSPGFINIFKDIGAALVASYFMTMYLSILAIPFASIIIGPLYRWLMVFLKIVKA